MIFSGPHVVKDDRCLMGKYGSLIAFTQIPSPEDSGQLSKRDVGQQLGQHIVGMNPRSIGKMEEDVEEEEAGEETEEKQEGNEKEESKDDKKEDEEKKKKAKDDDESVLLKQEFLADSSLTVKEFLIKNSAEVLDFLRFQCGEELPSDDD